MTFKRVFLAVLVVAVAPEIFGASRWLLTIGLQLLSANAVDGLAARFLVAAANAALIYAALRAARAAWRRWNPTIRNQLNRLERLLP
jgi:hypothetical protein